MTRRLSNLLENHYALVVSSLISSIIIALAILAGISARRSAHSRAWAMDSDHAPAAVTESRREKLHAVEVEAQEPRAVPRTPAETIENTPAPGVETRVEQPAPGPALEITAPPLLETATPPPPVEQPPGEKESAPVPVETKSEKPAPVVSEKRELRTLRPRRSLPTRQGRILRPRR